jgi:hypothetical protein
MISETRGVAATRRLAWAESSVEEIVYDARWRTEPGWFAFDAASPTICLAASEVGGLSSEPRPISWWRGDISGRELWSSPPPAPGL